MNLGSLTANAWTIDMTGSTFNVWAVTITIGGWVSATFNNFLLNYDWATTTLASDISISGKFSNIKSSVAQSLVSDVPWTYRKLTLTGTQDLKLLNATDIDSSLGEEIYVFRAWTFTHTLNWYELMTPLTVASVF